MSFSGKSIVMRMLGAVLRQQLLDAVPRIEQIAQRLIVVERRNDERHILAHVRLAEPRSVKHRLRRIGQVRGEHVVDHAVGIRLVKRFQTAGEERESRAREHALGLALLEIIRQIEDGIAGSIPKKFPIPIDGSKMLPP